MSFLWDLIQQRQISNRQKENQKTQGRVREAASDFRSLKEQHEQLSLVCEAMWELLRDSVGVSETMLLNKVEEIDLRDGSLDGKNNRARACNACGRKINPQRGLCLFCGNRDIIESAWDKV